MAGRNGRHCSSHASQGPKLDISARMRGEAILNRRTVVEQALNCLSSYRNNAEPE